MPRASKHRKLTASISRPPPWKMSNNSQERERATETNRPCMDQGLQVAHQPRPSRLFISESRQRKQRASLTATMRRREARVVHSMLQTDTEDVLRKVAIR